MNTSTYKFSEFNRPKTTKNRGGIKTGNLDRFINCCYVTERKDETEVKAEETFLQSQQASSQRS